MTPITTTNNLLRRLYQDDRNEGDLNEFSSQTVAAALVKRLVKVVACSRPYKNLVLTPERVKEASKLG